MMPRILIEPQFSIEAFEWRGRGSEIHSQSSYSLLYIAASGNSEYPSGTTFLLNPQARLELGKLSDKSRVLLVRFTPQYLIDAAARQRAYRTGSNLLFVESRTTDARLGSVLKTIIGEVSESAPGWRELVNSLVNQLAVYLLRSHLNLKRSEELELSRVGIVDRRLRRAIEYMHDNCERDLSLAEIAASVYVSAFHFARLFKKILGVTPHHYLLAIRIDRARKMLAETDLAIAEVGARAGYGSQSHFTKVFREETGMTPMAFRETVRGY